MDASTNTTEISSLELKMANLTACERGFMLLLADDLSNAEIAEKLCLTLKSVENYKIKIGDKLDLKGRDKLSKFARKHPAKLQHWHDQYPPPLKE